METNGRGESEMMHTETSKLKDTREWLRNRIRSLRKGRDANAYQTRRSRIRAGRVCRQMPMSRLLAQQDRMREQEAGVGALYAEQGQEILARQQQRR